MVQWITLCVIQSWRGDLPLRCLISKLRSIHLTLLHSALLHPTQLHSTNHNVAIGTQWLQTVSLTWLRLTPLYHSSATIATPCCSPGPSAQASCRPLLLHGPSTAHDNPVSSSTRTPTEPPKATSEMTSSSSENTVQNCSNWTSGKPREKPWEKPRHTPGEKFQTCFSNLQNLSIKLFTRFFTKLVFHQANCSPAFLTRFATASHTLFSPCFSQGFIRFFTGLFIWVSTKFWTWFYTRIFTRLHASTNTRENTHTSKRSLKETSMKPIAWRVETRTKHLAVSLFRVPGDNGYLNWWYLWRGSVNITVVRTRSGRSSSWSFEQNVKTKSLLITCYTFWLPYCTQIWYRVRLGF